MRGLIADLFKEFMAARPAAPVMTTKTVSLPEPLEAASAPVRHTVQTPTKKVTASNVPKPAGKTRRGMALLAETMTSDSDADSEGSSSSTDGDQALSSFAARASQRLVSACSFHLGAALSLSPKATCTTALTPAAGHAVGPVPNRRSCWILLMWSRRPPRPRDHHALRPRDGHADRPKRTPS